MERFVLDTNCLLVSLASKSPYHKIWTSFLAGDYVLCVSSEILLEYEEIIGKKTNSEIADAIINTILTRPNVERTSSDLRFQLIKTDVDDNKFVDCAIVSNAKYIVTNDHHFDILNQIDFPKVEIINIDGFNDYLIKKETMGSFNMNEPEVQYDPENG